MGLAASKLRMTTTGGGGGAFAPDDIAGLVAWWDASNAGAITGSPTVTAWADLSGNGHTLTAAGNPQTGATTKNSLNVIDLDGTGDYFDTASFTQAQPMTVFYVDIRGTGANQTGVASVGGNLQIGYNSAQVRFFAGSAEIGAFGLSAAWNISTFIINGASSQSWRNATAGVGGNPGSSGTTTGFRIGAERNLVGTLTGSIAEIVIYGSALGTTDREAVRDYLNDKWAVY